MSNQTAAIHVSYYVYASAESAGAVDITIDRVQFDNNLMERLSRRMPGYSADAIFHTAMQVGMRATNYTEVRSDAVMAKLTVTDHGIMLQRNQPNNPDNVDVYLVQTRSINQEVRLLTTLAASVLSNWTGVAITTIGTQLQYDSQVSEEMRLSEQLDQCVVASSQHARLLRRTIVAAPLLAIITVILTAWLGNGLLLLALTAGFLVAFYCWPSHQASQQKNQLWRSYMAKVAKLCDNHPEWNVNYLGDD